MAYLSLITVNQYRMHLWVEEELEGIGDALERDFNGFGFVGWNWDLEVLNAAFFHECDILCRVILWDQRAELICQYGDIDGHEIEVARARDIQDRFESERA